MNIDQRNRIRALLEIFDRKRLVREGVKEAITSIAYFGRGVLRRGEGNRWIAERLRSEAPAAIGKIGASEMRALVNWRNGKPFSSFNFEEMHLAGVFPTDQATLNRFGVSFSQTCADLDLLAVWGGRDERKFLDELCPGADLCRLTDLEPYYWDAPWSMELKNKRVLVISPFVESIERQYARRLDVWPETRLLPAFELKTLRMPHSDALVPSSFPSWFGMYEDLIQQGLAIDFDVAIVGAGAASLPLCAAFKRAGKIGIHLGGATQILFGISGKRWESHPQIAAFQNQSWVRPSSSETPEKIYKVERGAYW